PETWIDIDLGEGITASLAANLERWGAEALRQRDVRAEFAARYRADLATIPWQRQAPTDLDALAALIEQAEGLKLEQLWRE
ncbi:MAG: hypothetical protein ACRDVM_07120, partial [Acidimicrobiia bacterium]